MYLDEHKKCKKWIQLSSTLQSVQTIDSFIVLQSGIQQWNHIIEHIAAIDQFLDQQCLSFSATWSKLYNPSNGKVSWFVAVEAATGSLLIDCILRKLSNMNIPITDLLGQGYDNGSNMKGKISGVQQRIRNWHRELVIFLAVLILWN